MSGLVVPSLAVGVAGVAIAVWLRMISRVELVHKRWIVNTLMGSAVALGALALTQAPGTLGGILEGSVIALGAVYFGLLSIAGQSKQPPAIAVGGPLLDFTALDHNGNPFALSSLNGKPILMKFFRGHW